MKLSELIARLAEMLEEHGDIPVQYQGPDYSPVTDVWFDDKRETVVVD